ncbi:hypothetical protein B296_00023559 [Ensete ventricosum]|uniref:Uncharacterized protein n=1 Tax=Ensete ventricosum TaxID=4639 RepID=A0A427AWF4_ENSVE|nr:hypothetical protein B296_00023559 [Ensete ventricosum]
MDLHRSFSCDISSRKDLQEEEEEEEEEEVEMGSLTAGWSSPVVDPETGRITSFTSVLLLLLLHLLMYYAATCTALLKRNKSLTKEEIDSFWKLHRPTKEEEEDFHASLSSPRTPQESDRLRLKKTVMGFPDTPDMEKAPKIGDWWTRSNWAFLNEPPRDELSDSAHKYTAQFHVAHLAVKKS